MKKILLIVTSLALVGFVGGALAQEAELPAPGITPDNFFYFLDLWGERIGMFFAFSAEAKAEKALAYAEEKLAEAEAMADKVKPNETGVASKEYEGYLSLAQSKIQEAKEEGRPIEEVSARVAEAASKHLSVLERVLEKVPEEAKEAITKAKEVSITGQKNALKALAEENPERATEINLRAAEARLNRAKAKAEEGKIDEAEEAIKEFENQHRFGEEISEIAKGLGKDITTVEQLVGKATSVHLEILAEVYERVPEEAKPSIEKAMEVSVKGHERAVEVIKESLKEAPEVLEETLKEVPEEAPIPPGIPEAVQERIREKVKEEIEKEKAQKVTFEQLFSNLEQYNGKYIILEGFFFAGWETIVLSESLKYSGYAEGHLVPQGRMLWIEGGIPKEVYDQLYQQQMMGPIERYGKVRVTGKFQYGGKYGHLGQYDYQIIPSEVELLPWSPPEVREEVTFDQLFANPEQYNGKVITLEGFYFSGFEVVVLSESLEYSGHAEGHLVPQGKMLWVEGGIPKEVYDRLYQQQMMGPIERYGKVRVTGKFEYGEKYGHLGGYDYQIIPSEVELLPWSPPEE